MNTLLFILSAVAYALLTVFIYFNYPVSWRKNHMFITLVLLWRAIGLSSVVIIFTAFNAIPYENVRYEITRLGSCYYITTTVQAILYLLRIIIRRIYLLIAKLAGKKVDPKKQRWITDKRTHAFVFILASFVIFGLGYFNIDFLQSTEYEVKIAAQSEEKELKICLISDIHAGSGTWEYTYDDMAEMINAADADVLLIAGDVFDETTGPRDVENLARAFEKIKQPRYGIYYVYGNHDNSVDDWSANRMREMGVTVLEDEMVIIGEDIQLIGHSDQKVSSKDMPTLYAECAPDPDKPIIILTHRPKGFQQMADLGCDLVMVGHTHGFNIPQFMGANMLGDMYYGSKEYGGMTAITTSGISGWGFHYKWPAKSEVVTIRVTFE